MRIGNYEIYFAGDTHRWATEEKPHVWVVSLKVVWLSPAEKKHRAEWEALHKGEKYPTR